MFIFSEKSYQYSTFCIRLLMSDEIAAQSADIVRRSSLSASRRPQLWVRKPSEGSISHLLASIFAVLERWQET